MEQGSSFTDQLIVIALIGFQLLLAFGFASFLGTLFSNLCGCGQEKDDED